MSFLKKLFGGGGKDKEAQKAPVQDQDLEKELAGLSNAQQVENAGLDEEEEKSSWLSRAWGGMKDLGSAMGKGGKEGAMMGGAITAIPGALVGGGLGAGIGAGVGKAKGDTGAGAKEGGMWGAKILGAITGVVGAAIGGIAGMASGAIDQATYDEEELLAATADIPGYHVILEQMAHTYAYGKGDEKTLEAWGYELSSEYEDKNSGFRVVAFSPMSDTALDPDGNALKPVVAFRGTANGGGVMDDLNAQGIGTYQFSRNEKEIENTIAKAEGTAAPDVTGHSLGGALAQLCAARFGSQVGNIITFQAAGIEGEEAQRIDSEEHKATHYRAGGDLVHTGGEGFAVGDVVQFDAKGLDTALSHMTFPLAQLNALRGKTDSDAPHVEGARGSGDEWVIDKKGDYHNGHWADEEVQEESNLHQVKKFDDSNDTEQSGLIENLIGGRENAVKMAKGAGSLAEKAGITGKQDHYAKAWREIRGVAMNIQSESDIPKVRDRIIDLCIKHEVAPKDHGQFISQSEAAMLDALEMKKLAGGDIS